MAETLITDVHGQDYVVLPCSQGFLFAPCEYDAQAHITVFDPKLGIKVFTAKPIVPLAKHERQIRKLISVNLRIPVSAPGLARSYNYQVN